MIGHGTRRNVKKSRFLYLTSIIDYLKANEYRIATHSESRTDGPLASRDDFSKYVSLVKNNENVDILALDRNKRITIATCVHNDELTAHFQKDPTFIQGLKSIISAGGENIHYMFLTNGVIIPHLVMSSPFGSGETKDELLEDLGISQSEFKNIFSTIDFKETRFTLKKIHKLDDQKLYLRKLIGKVRTIVPQYFDSDFDCDCGDKFFEGSYTINYWKKTCKCVYWVCPSCGVQMEAENTVNKVANFMQGFN